MTRLALLALLVLLVLGCDNPAAYIPPPAPHYYKLYSVEQSSTIRIRYLTEYIYDEDLRMCFIRQKTHWIGAHHNGARMLTNVPCNQPFMKKVGLEGVVFDEP